MAWGANKGSVPNHIQTVHITVQPGQTVWSISEQIAGNQWNPTAVEAWIQAHNYVDAGDVQVGQVLVVPKKANLP